MGARLPAGHPLRESAKHAYHQICSKVCKWYGVADAERWYQMERREILDQCRPDPAGITRFTSLSDYWENRQMEQKWRSDPPSQPGEKPEVHAGVEIYAVRAPGAGGELGVLTTTHDLDAFISGLASAASKLAANRQAQQLERDLSWIFKNAFPIAFKLAGYKADQVVERHVLMCGSNAPAADDIVASA